MEEVPSYPVVPPGWYVHAGSPQGAVDFPSAPAQGPGKLRMFWVVVENAAAVVPLVGMETVCQDQHSDEAASDGST